MTIDITVFKAVEEAFRDRLEVLRLKMHHIRGDEDAYRSAVAQYNAAVEESAREYDRRIKQKRARMKEPAAKGAR